MSRRRSEARLDPISVLLRGHLESMGVRDLVSVIHDCDREVRRRGWHPTYSAVGGYSAYYTAEAAEGQTHD